MQDENEFTQDKIQDSRRQPKGLFGKAMLVRQQCELEGKKMTKVQNKAGTSKKGERAGDAIVEVNGIFMIQNNLETSSVKLDPYLQELVNSVLR